MSDKPGTSHWPMLTKKIKLPTNYTPNFDFWSKKNVNATAEAQEVGAISICEGIFSLLSYTHSTVCLQG